ncbi:hypothetical protein LDENG_00007260 [Lucifuga dentata]|nr:hypothetical protein LDENG_00007260 [Lucifuga dentata]
MQQQLEQTEWDDVNKLLQNHGFRPVCFADPVENKNLSDLVLLDKKSAVDIRTTLKTMLSDSDRRQALIQELIKSNNQLKQEVQRHAGREQREELLDAVKVRVQELEERYLAEAVQHHAQTRHLQQETRDAHKLCETLQQNLSEQRQEVDQLQRKLYFTVTEEEQRRARHKQLFHNICKTTRTLTDPPSSPSPDPQLLDVIDFYETQIIQLQGELRSLRGEAEEEEGMKRKSGSVTPSFRSVLKVLGDELKESEAQRAELSRELERYQQDFRPTLKELKFYKHKARHLDGSNKASKSWKEDKSVTGNPSDLAAESTLCAQYYHLLKEISSILTNPEAPLRLLRHKPATGGVAAAEFRGLVATLEVWAQQLRLLKELQRGLNKLAVRLAPCQLCDGGDAVEGVKVEDMMLQVDTMLENTADEKVLRSPTRHTLESIVSHFLKLFDVASVSGVFPRMNEVYTRLAEMTNTMRNLRDVLRLDDSAPLAEVVNAVARLASCSEDAVPWRLHGLLVDTDVDTIIEKVKQHEEFFPAFHALVMDILQTLGLSRMEDVLPALRSLTSG